MSLKNTDRNMNKASGFTLIELIVVILILAILAAVALPRFTNLQKDARIAKLNAAKGSVAAASSLLHAAVLVKNGIADTTACTGSTVVATNSTGATGGTVCTENGKVNLVYAYPAVRTITAGGGILSAAGITPSFNPTTAELQNDGYAYSVSATVATFQVIGGTSAATCAFTYTQAAAANAAPTISTVVTTGC